MSELENQHFSGWISSLYETDGIIDDMMSSCSPQDFYLLVPTLFSQSLLACEKGVLDFNTLRGGLECRWQKSYDAKKDELIVARSALTVTLTVAD